MRAVALYRASTKQQTDEDNDIPNQKKIVTDYIYNQGWDIVREFTEGGVSGFKVKAEDRDALQSIKRMANNNEKDFYLTYGQDVFRKNEGDE